MTKPNFENNEALNDLFEGFKTIDEVEEEKALQEAQKEDTTSNEEPLKEETIKEEKTDSKKGNKTPIKKSQIYSEVDSVVCDYLNLKTIVTGDSKKEILNKIFKEEIKKTFRLNDNATDEEMQKAIDKKMKQIEGMKNLFK